MSEISASEVKKLRDYTGAGMMDCKKALRETGGDFDAAVEYIRKKGQAAANKRADREASEGVALAKTNSEENFGVIVVLNCETDFVAKNDEFVKLADSIVNLALEKQPGSVDELKELNLDERRVIDHITDQIGIIGEKIELSYYDKLEAARVIPYIHPGNKLATLVGFNKNVDTEVGRNVAMQIAAMNPVSVDKEGVPQDIIDKELEIGKEQAKQEGKPENIQEKIAQGKLNKFFKESTLLEQDYTRDSKKTVRQYLQESDREVKVTGFLRYSLTG